MTDSSLSHTTIWVVEDHALLCDSVCEVIEGATGSHVLAFGSCEEALVTEPPGKTHPVPAVILLDIGLPGLSGLEGIRLFKERYPETEIVMFTVFDDEARIFEAIAAGATGYLLKSESLPRIAEAIREVLTGGRPMSPEIARLVLERFSRLEPSPTTTDLSDREQETLRLLVDGLAKKEIADRLGISLHTVDTYVRRIYKKLHVNTLGGAVAKALREGLV